jgi:hippurate hydrolase
MPVGKFATRVGPMLAAFDMWSATFRGTGGHGGLAPHLATDPTLVQANFVMGLQTIVGRNVAPNDTGVVSVGYVLGGMEEAPNVIPSKVVLGGTCRSYMPHVRDTIERRMRELAQSVASAFGCTAEVDYVRMGEALINSPEQTAIGLAAARNVVGADHVRDNLPPTTGGEDFAEMMQIKPGTFMRLGNGSAPDRSFHAPHTPKYDFNDEIIPLGVAYWVNVVREELGERRGMRD